MLTLLRIKNLALVEELEWSPTAGFVAITGETGAGKSVILGALKLLIGERADKSLIRTGADACSVEAEFLIPADLQLNPLLIEQGVEPCVEGHLILKRTFSTSAASRQFINGSPTTLGVLKWVGDALVDLHGPHDHQSLFSPEKQTELLDAFAKASPERLNYAELYDRLRELEQQRQELEGEGGSLERELDLLRHQIREIRSFPLPPEKEEEFLAEYTRASNARRLAELTATLLNALDEGDDTILGRMAESQRLLNELERIDASTAPHAEAHRTATVDLEELVSSLRAYADSLEFDEATLQLLEDRVSLLESLKRKYGGSLKSALRFADEAETKLARMEHREEELATINQAIAETKTAMARLAETLTAKRREAAPMLAAEVSAHLRDLGFKQTGFEVQLSPASSPKRSGADDVEFLFAPNPGEPARPLRAIASSGEISRVMLAIKTALAGEDSIALMVFDEIDANVGGEIAHAVATKMRHIGQTHQVLVITHLPQVASKAASHFVVVKDIENDRTHSRLYRIEGPEREAEIARMLGGRSTTALEHARELLAGGTE
ncbi:MAG: DNA repair protein RecN [Verrucomicrobiia bacterium]